MRARLVFEKFTEQGDPIRDMGIGLLHRYNEIKELFKAMDKQNIDFSAIDYDKDELTIRVDATEILQLSDYRSKGHWWEDIGVNTGFVLNYYIDVIMRENKIVRSFELTNNDIKDFEFWDERVLTNEVLETSDDDISQMIVDDHESIDSSNALYIALDEAWDLAEVEFDKTQKNKKLK